MTKTTKTHALWATAAAVAFGVGAQFPARPQAVAAPAHTDGSAGTREAAAVSAVGSGTKAAPARGTTSNAGGDSKPEAFTDQHIAELGERFRTSGNPLEKRFAFSELIAGLTAENALLVREQIEHMDQHSAEYREFHYAWGAVAGADAALFGIGTEGDDMMPALAGWAGADSAAAISWFQGLDISNDPRFAPLIVDREIPADGLRDHLMRGLVQGLADSNSAAASDFVLAAAEGGDQSAYHGMMHSVVEARLRTEQPADAAVWAEGIGDGRLRGQAMNRVADHFARRDLEGARAWATGLASDAGGAAAIGQVSAHLARKNAGTAMAWLAELPAGDGQNQGMNRAMREWTARDPGAASQHLSGMEASPARDAAVTGFSQRIAWEDPEAAVNWAATIGSEAQRHATLEGTARTWVRRDREAATSWLAGSGLPAELRQSILAEPDRE